MKHGTLEGLESCTDSPGLGFRRVRWIHDPTPGERFEVFHSLSRYLRTSEVKSVRRLADGSIGIRTLNSTYILREDPDDEPGSGTAD